MVGKSELLVSASTITRGGVEVMEVEVEVDEEEEEEEEGEDGVKVSVGGDCLDGEGWM